MLQCIVFVVTLVFLHSEVYSWSHVDKNERFSTVRHLVAPQIHENYKNRSLFYWEASPTAVNAVSISSTPISTQHNHKTSPRNQSIQKRKHRILATTTIKDQIQSLKEGDSLLETRRKNRKKRTKHDSWTEVTKKKKDQKEELKKKRRNKKSKRNNVKKLPEHNLGGIGIATAENHISNIPINLSVTKRPRKKYSKRKMSRKKDISHSSISKTIQNRIPSNLINNNVTQTKDIKINHDNTRLSNKIMTDISTEHTHIRTNVVDNLNSQSHTNVQTDSPYEYLNNRLESFNILHMLEGQQSSITDMNSHENNDDKKCKCDHICLSGNGPNDDQKCDCFNGFRLEDDEISCRDIDECSESKNTCSHHCRNLPGSFVCECPVGYTLDSTVLGKCRDINECLLNNGHGPCQDTCRNLVGSYECTCEKLRGTRLAKDGISCISMDACATAGCSHECLNARGGAFCLCPIGFQLGRDWKTCEAVASELQELREHNLNEQTFDMNIPDKVVCPPLFPPRHGFLECSRDQKTESSGVTNRPGTICLVTCPVGYRLAGRYNRTCTKHGKWSGPDFGKCVHFAHPTIKCFGPVVTRLKPGEITAKVQLQRPQTSLDWRHVKVEPRFEEENLQFKLPQGQHKIRFSVTHPVTGLNAECNVYVVVKKAPKT